MTPSLSTTDLRREFGSITALDGVDLDLEGPQILGVAGPNGSGKTTLIKCLLGLVTPTDGDATIGGTSSGSFTAADRRRLGYMPQGQALYDDLTVWENVSFFASLYGVEDQQAIEQVLSLVDLTDRRDASIDELSGGMIRRTSLACALVHDPDVLFLDEPTVGLDPQLRSTMWDRFRERRDNGTLMVISTHYLGEVSRCDRVLFLRDGSVLALDSPDEFLARTGTADLESAFLALLDDSTGTETGAVDTDERGDGRPSASRPRNGMEVTE